MLKGRLKKKKNKERNVKVDPIKYQGKMRFVSTDGADSIPFSFLTYIKPILLFKFTMRQTVSLEGEA